MKKMGGGMSNTNEQFAYTWNDERVGINWPINSPILSERDILAMKRGN